MSKLFSAKEAAEALGVTVHTLSVWRSCNRYSLPYIKVGRLVKYKEEDLKAFIEAQRKNG